MENYLNLLNPPQQEAVLQKEGPMMIIAGAGSGKTRVLTYKIAYLIQQGVDPFQILSLTFTNKAAREMKNRIAGVVGESEAKNIWMGTFHAVFAKILRFEADKLGFPSNFTIYDTDDSVKLITSIIKELQLDKEIYKPKQVFGRISKYKNNLITVKAYYNSPELIEADNAAMRPKMGEVYQQYVDRCFKAGAMDFDDLLLRTNELLARFPEVLAKYQNRFRYILVDEYQDTNHSQYLIVRALADRFQNICVVGDDSQSIYAFRGANIQNILNFQKDYADIKIFKLEQNYRSTKNIVSAANSVIENNKTKLDKTIWTGNDEGEKIKIIQTHSEAEEGNFVASSIFENQMQHQLQNTDFAVLYRTNAQSRAIEEALRKKNIKYRIYGGVSFYLRKEVKDILAYLRLIINHNDEEAFKRIINYPARGIGQTTIDRLIVKANELNVSLFYIAENIEKIDVGINSGTRQKLSDFAMLIKSLKIFSQTDDAFEVANQVVNKTFLINELKKEDAFESTGRIENVEELLNGIRFFIIEQQDLADGDTSLTNFLQNVALATDFDKEDPEAKNTVSLMTVHMAKGLEFKVVYIVGLEENLFPSAMSINTRSEIEEERRLFYVALTRAEIKVYVTYSLYRSRWGQFNDTEPSRFIEEIDDKYTEFIGKQKNNNNSSRTSSFLKPDIFETKNPVIQPKISINIPKNLKKVSEIKPKTQGEIANIQMGSFVIHETFGKGEVLSLDGTGPNRKAEIKFENAGIKKLLLQFAKLQLI
ncbi:MAG: 3'-5' exonuclease [Flavobacteriaceae bacterium]|nr:3'-5' exonuclease [Flavobacteriaceae bacterium]